MMRIHGLGSFMMGMWALVIFECGGSDPEPNPQPAESCLVCDPNDVQTCHGVPSLCAKSGDSYCCAGG